MSTTTKTSPKPGPGRMSGFNNLLVTVGKAARYVFIALAVAGWMAR